MRRVFVAIRPGQSQIERASVLLKKVRTSFDSYDIDVKWMPLNNLHITLKFLGNLDDSQITDVIEKLRVISENTKAFPIRMEGMSAFDNPHEARVIFIDVQRSQALLNLQTAVEAALQMSLEQEYYPHLTLGRLRNPRSVESCISPFKKIDLGKGKIERLSLFESHIQGNFPVYKELAGFDLKEAPVR